jgi:phage recombination protein Bet
MNNEQVAVLKRTIAKGCTDDEFALFLQVCRRTQLDPFAKQICPVARWDKKENRNVMQIQVQIDGFRVLAQRTGQYGGSDRPLFDEGLTLYEHLQTKRGKPKTCSITVYRLVGGHRCPFTAEITWDDFYPGQKQGFMWDSKPYQMLSKASESQALRKAFQLELAHLETPEEESIVIPTQAQLSRSDDWMEMQRRFLHCSSAKELQSLIQESTDRLPVGAYQIDRVATAAKERIEMRSTAPVLAPEATKLELTQEQQRIYFFIQKTKTDIQQIKTIATRLQLPKSGAEMNADQAFVLIGEMLIEWAIGGQWLDRSIVTVLLSKSIERTKTDLELWEDFSLSVESYQRNGVRASPF